LDFKIKCEILNQLWSDYRYDEDFEDFVEYNDIGLPLASFIDEGLVDTTPRAEIYIGETFDLLVAALDIEDKDYDSLEAMFFEAGRVD
jgi:hypothetical protein